MILAAALVLAPPPPTEGEWSLVVARAVAQDDPRPLDCPPDDICLDADFRGRFDRAATVVGSPIPRSFVARVVQHTRWMGKPRVLLMLSRQPGGAWSVFTQRFADDHGWACIDHRYTQSRLPPLSVRADVEDRPDEVCVRL